MNKLSLQSQKVFTFFIQPTIWKTSFLLYKLGAKAVALEEESESDWKFSYAKAVQVLRLMKRSIINRTIEQKVISSCVKSHEKLRARV